MCYIFKVIIIGITIIILLALIFFILAGSAKLSPVTSALVIGIATLFIVAFQIEKNSPEQPTQQNLSAEQYRQDLSKMSEFQITQELLSKADYGYIVSLGTELRGNLTHEEVMRLDLSRFTQQQKNQIFNQLISSGKLR